MDDQSNFNFSKKTIFSFFILFISFNIFLYLPHTRERYLKPNIPSFIIWKIAPNLQTFPLDVFIHRNGANVVLEEDSIIIAPDCKTMLYRHLDIPNLRVLQPFCKKGIHPALLVDLIKKIELSEPMRIKNKASYHQWSLVRITSKELNEVELK